MEKTLGGARLGAGKQRTVDLHNFERSTHNMGYLWRSTMSPGTLVPFMIEIGLPGDTFDINLDAYVNTHPTIGPLFGSYKLQLDVFVSPMRLYQGQLHNNKLGIGLKMDTVKLPQIRLAAADIDINTVEDLDNAQVNPSCILAYLGIRGVGIGDGAAPTQNRDFDAGPLLTYWDTYKNYYANKQEKIGVVIHTPKPASVTNITSANLDGTNITQSPAVVNIPLDSSLDTLSLVTTATQPPELVVIYTNLGPILLSEFGTILENTALLTRVVYNFNRWGLRRIINWDYIGDTTAVPRPIELETFDLENLDQMRELILSQTMAAGPYIINTANLAPYDLVLTPDGDYRSMIASQEGLAIKTYQSDIFNNWLETEAIDGPNGINAITAVDTSGDNFQITALILARKVYDMLNRIQISGGSYDDYLDAQYMTDRITRVSTPVYMGGLSKEIIFQEVISNSESTGDSGAQPLGTLAGKGTLSKKHKGGQVTIKVDEPSYIMGLVSITPRIDYSQGNRWFTQLKSLADLHVPMLDGIGFEESINEWRAWWDTYENVDGTWQQTSAGKVPAWTNYTTNYNRVYGNFAIPTNEMFMVLNRQYTPVIDGDHFKITDVTTYIDPAKYNNIFAETSIDSQNFWVQIGVDMTARRKMSAKVMPNL